MPIDFSSETIPNFRDHLQTDLVLLQRPLVRSLRHLSRLRRGADSAESRSPVKSRSPLRRSPLPGSLY